VVHAASLSLTPGSIERIVVPNGAGKSTLLRAVTGDAELLGGRVVVAGREVTRVPANRLVARGLAWVPQLDDVFTTLTVVENLELGGFLLDRRRLSARVDEVLDLFPLLVPLRSRVAGRLSGGERKLLAIARALMPSPTTLLLDEPTAGLSPEMTGLVLGASCPDSGTAGLRSCPSSSGRSRRSRSPLGCT
jgi:branched-chain amino acid transport system ATP-binding protein